MITTQKKFQASLDKLYEMLNWIDQQCKQVGFSDPNALQLKIALEEAIVNIIHYAYVGKIGDIEITCTASLQPKGIIIVLRDSGIAFNPLEQEAKNAEIFKSDNMDDRPIGGCGIHMIVKIMDKVEYARVGNENVLTLTKYTIP